MANLKGKLVGADEMTDLAVVKVGDGKLPFAEIAAILTRLLSANLLSLLAILWGLNLQGSVTSGVISALNRTLDINDKRG